MGKLNDSRITSLIETDKEMLQQMIPNVQEAKEKLKQAEDKL